MQQSAERQVVLDRIARGAGLGAAVLGALALVGWSLGIEALKSFLPGMMTMKPNAAAGFVVLGLGVVPARGWWAARGAAVVAMVLGAATLVEYVAGINLGIDELAFADPATARNGLPPGRMAFATALAFVLLGAATLLVERRRPAAAQGPAFVGLLIALFSLVAYLFAERAVTTLSPYSSLALHTAIGVLLLAVAVLCRCTAAGPMALLAADDAGGAALRRLLPGSVAVLFALGSLGTLGLRLGLYSLSVALVIQATAATLILAAAVWHNASSLSRAEAGRRRDLDRFRLTLTSIGDAVIATDAAGQVAFLNAAAEGLTGWPGAEAAGRPLAEVFRIVDAGTRRPVDDPVTLALASGQPVERANHTLLLARDGVERSIEHDAAPILGDDGATSGAVLVFRDVDERQRAERLIEGQRQALERIAAGRPLAEILDPLCRLVEGEAVGEVVVAVLLAEAGGSRWALGAGPSLPAGYAAVAEAVAVAHGVASAGLASRLGEPAYVADVAADPLHAGLGGLATAHGLGDSWTRPILSGRGEVLGIVALHRRRPAPPSPADLRGVELLTRTASIAIERDRARAELTDARSRLDAALSAGSIGTWSWDLARDWVVPDANLIAFFGIGPEDAAGSTAAPYLRAVHPDDVGRVEQALGDAIAANGRYQAEYRIVSPDGSTRPVEARGRVEAGPDGRPARMAGIVLDISDRKRVEQEKDQFALLVENAGDFIGLAALDGTPTYLNATARRMMGVDDREAARALPLPDHFFPEDRPFLRDEFLPRVLAEGFARTEIRLRHLRTGEARWIDYGVTLLRSRDGVPLALATIGRDLTERRAADEERRAFAARIEAQARLFDSALSNLPDHAYIFGLDGRFSYANRRLLDLWQLTLDEVRARDLPELGYTPKLAARIRGQLRKVIETKARLSDETPFDGPGESGVYEYILSPVLAPDGSVEAIAGSSRDITERKRAEEATRLRAARLQKLAGLATRINSAHDVDSVLRVVSREALELFEADRASIHVVLNPEFPQAIHVVCRAVAGDDCAEAAAPVDPGALDLAGALGDDPRPVRLDRAGLDAAPELDRISRLGDAPRVEHGWLAAPLVSRDRKAMGLIQLADRHPGEFTVEDEALIVQLSLLAGIAIENARLYDELRGNDRRKDEFLAMLAHELRNPLAAISNATRLIVGGGFAEHGAWSLGVIGRQLHHLTRLIEDLLDVSRISRGKIELRRDLIEASSILDSAAATVRPLVEERHHALELAVDRGGLWVHADPTRLEQVVVNLLNNAAKYSEDGGLVRLSAAVEGDQVVIRVVDRGLGIPPEKLPQMFELFAQGDRSLARSEGGLGIGLTVVKKLVELHGGTIQARSDGPGHGSEFAVRLPAAAPAATPADAGPAAPPAAPPEPRRARILVVDDNVDTARGMTRLLKLVGHTTGTAHSGPEAIEAARRLRPEVVLLDIGLPGMSGYEVAAALRREESCRDAIIIAVSGYGQDEDRRRSREAGFDHHLLKPLDHDALLEIIAGPA